MLFPVQKKQPTVNFRQKTNESWHRKQPGLYAVKYHPIGGVPKVSKFGEIYESIKDVSDAEIRISPDEDKSISST